MVAVCPIRVAMMQTADLKHPQDLPHIRRLDRPRFGRVFRESSKSSRDVTVRLFEVHSHPASLIPQCVQGRHPRGPPCRQKRGE